MIATETFPDFSAPKPLGEIADSYTLIRNPNAMMVDGAKELERHVNVTIRLLEAHYAYARENIEGFPQDCCGISSEKVLYATWEMGYLNAAKIFNPLMDHSFVVLPFVMPQGNGVILADPTSDQNWSGKKLPENFVEVLKDHGLATHPYYSSGRHTKCYVHHAGILSLPPGHEDLRVRDFLDLAFANPVRLN